MSSVVLLRPSVQGEVLYCGEMRSPFYVVMLMANNLHI